MDERIRLAIEVNSLREEFVVVHNDIFAPPLWRTVRRALPLPFVFEAIDFARHADRLAVVRLGLTTRQASLIETTDNASPSDGAKALSSELERFIIALTATVDELFHICIGMAADRRARPTWSEYNRRVTEYEAHREAQIAIGVDLQRAFDTFKREA